MSDEKKNDSGSDSEEKTNFKVPEAKPINEILNKDTQDEALTKYKNSLLGDAEKCAQELSLEFVRFRIVTDDNKTLEYPVNHLITPADFDKTINVEQEQEISEGHQFTAWADFKVLTGVVYGLACTQNIIRLKIQVDSEKFMLGTYSASDKMLTAKLGQNTIPSGMQHRGSYKVVFKVNDDDKKVKIKIVTKIKVVK